MYFTVVLVFMRYIFKKSGARTYNLTLFVGLHSANSEFPGARTTSWYFWRDFCTNYYFFLQKFHQKYSVFGPFVNSFGCDLRSNFHRFCPNIMLFLCITRIYAKYFQKTWRKDDTLYKIFIFSVYLCRKCLNFLSNRLHYVFVRICG